MRRELIERNFKRAKKYTLETVPKDSIEMIFFENSNDVEYHQYFYNISELYKYCSDNNIATPKYVWGTYKEKIRIDAYNIAEDACEELHEDAYDSIDTESLEELQSFLDQWCEKQTGTTTYFPDYDCCIILNNTNGDDISV